MGRGTKNTGYAGVFLCHVWIRFLSYIFSSISRLENKHPLIFTLYATHACLRLMIHAQFTTLFLPLQVRVIVFSSIYTNLSVDLDIDICSFVCIDLVHSHFSHIYSTFFLKNYRALFGSSFYLLKRRLAIVTDYVSLTCLFVPTNINQP